MVVAFLCLPLQIFAGDDVFILTRDGNTKKVRVVKIDSEHVTYLDLKNKKKGEQTFPTDFVYMIQKEKGNNIFFDNEGNQMSSPIVKIDEKKDAVFTNKGEIFNVYNLTVKKDDISYKLRDKKKEPYITIPKTDVFMIRYADGTNSILTTYSPKGQKGNFANYDPKAIPTSHVTVEPTTAGLKQSVSQHALRPSANTDAKQPVSANAPVAQQTMNTLPANNLGLALEGANSQRIAYYNQLKPQWVEKPKSDFANLLYCKMDISPNSIMENNDVVIQLETGCFEGSGNYNNKIADIRNSAISVAVGNKTNQTIYIDLFNTYFIRGTEAQPYYVPSKTSEYSGGSSGGSVNLGSLFGSSVLSGVSVSSSSSSGATTETYSQRVIAIPPMSTRKLTPQFLFPSSQAFESVKVVDLSNKTYVNKKSVTKMPDFKKGDIVTFNEGNSPVTFSFFLTYGNDEIMTTPQNTKSTFYLSSIYGIDGNFLHNSYNGNNKVDKCLSDWLQPLHFFMHNQKK